MSRVRFGTSFGGSFEAALMLVIAALPIGAVLLLAPDIEGQEPVATAAMTAGTVAGVLLLVASLLCYVQWRTTTDPRLGWVVVGVVVISGQVFVNAGLVLAPRHADAVRSGWPLAHEVIAMLVVVGLCLAAMRTQATRMPDPMLLGIVLTVLVVSLRMILVSLDSVIPRSVVVALAVAVVAGHATIGALVMGNRRLPGWARWRLAATLVLVALGHATGLGRISDRLSGPINVVVLTAAGVLWTSATLALLREVDSHRSRTASLEGSLFEVETASRSAREQLHEVKSIVAGLSSATSLLHDPGVPDSVRARLETTIQSELARLERVVTMVPTQSRAFDLDAVLDTVLELHRARGRTIEWEPSGAHVHGRLDAVAEAVNILLENSAAHGGNAGSRVAVQSDPDEDVVRIRVSDEGPGIPAELRSRVFDWGIGRSDTPGQGIGLNLAQRLVTEQGGTITLDQPAVRGSAFVIRLPAARRSEEFDHDPVGH